MKNEPYDFAELISGYLCNELSKEEEVHLMQILENDEHKREILEYYKKTAPVQDRINYMNSLDIDAACNKLRQRYYNSKPGNNRRYSILKYVAVFAIMVSSVGVWLIFGKRDNKMITPSAINKSINDVLPGSSVAVLVLSDGKKVTLDTGKVALKEKDGTQLSGNQGGLAYSNNDASDKEEILYNTLIVPRGGTYNLRLPDGTNVWLNAMSELRFPVKFCGNERKVELIGEGYFEVAKNKNAPFKVLTRHQEIEVKGTHFNVNSYANENYDRTTLLEGSVKILSPSVPAKFCMLSPGEQAETNKRTGEMLVAKGNMKEAIAWKNGYFLFNDEKLESIMAKVSRWYDVEVVYEGEFDEKRSFLGQVERSRKLSSLLKVLELTGNVHFKISGRRIVVMP
ncbi:FecR family protein [Pedobacter nyackensis]|uniref:FecR family protein n=1 Tax=Pedobacter nyackensis TaxID=475255 RepID=UPI00292D4794|nr:FecR domain-containing protein [Pedobacter nyackensis]